MAIALTTPFAKPEPPEIEAAPLPSLREDIKLLAGASAADGSPTWTLHDPARHRFLRIGWLEFEILARWSLGRADHIARAVSSETTIRASAGDVLDVLRFVQRAGLIVPRGPTGITRLVEEKEGQRLALHRWLLKNYLFLKLRLINPDRFLDQLMPSLSWIFTRGFLIALALGAALGGYLISRQWQDYTHSLLHLFSLDGAIMVAIALSASKVIHECGHALMSKHFGCRVPAMGVAFLVLWPVLWTDTTDAWRLQNRHGRLAIDSAGMLAEITLAVIASLLWSVLPDGSLRTGMFLLSSSTWVLTVLVNVNPLMRFDGYFLLSDWLDIPNLQERGFALGRWWLRERLFGFGDPAPEILPRAKHRVMIVYALSTLTYRFFLFLGIALIVYHMAFKALGLFLMAVEIWWFIARPILNEVSVWRKRLAEARNHRRSRSTMIGLCLLLLLFVVPWRSSVIAPALLRDEHQTILYTDEPGELETLAQNGQQVQAGAPLFVLNSPEITFHKVAAQAALTGIDARMKGQAFDPDQLAALDAGWQELQEAAANLQSVEAQEAGLTVRAPFAGIVTDVPPNLRAGEWLPRRETLGMLTDPLHQMVEAYIDEGDLARLHAGAKARFVPENGEAPVALTLVSLELAPVRVLDTLDLASINGGGVAVRKDASGDLIPEAAIYRGILRPSDSIGRLPMRLRGTVVIDADRASILARLYRRAAAIVVREMGL